MPRPNTGPRLWLDQRRGTYTILDGRTNIRTGFTEVEHDKACEALMSYAGGIERPAARPVAVRTYKVEPRRGVYVIGYGPYVKIGFTVNLNDRLSQLQTPEKVEVYRLFEDAGFSYEKLLHCRFDEYRLNGEWFRKDGRLAEWIDGGCQ